MPDSQPAHTDRTLARDLMEKNFTSMNQVQTLRDVRKMLLATSKSPTVAKVIIVVDDEGRYAGLFTSRLLFKSLLSLYMPSQAVRKNVERWERELLDVAHERSEVRIHDALIAGLPTVSPSDRLHTLIEVSTDERVEYIPVLEKDRAVGVIPIAAVFSAAASLALRPDDEGIRMDGKSYR